MRAHLSILFVLILPAALAAEPAPEATNASDEKAAVDVAQLYETKCAKCHELTPVAERTYTPDEATNLVNEMQAKDTQWISDEEATQIATYIAEKYPKG